MLKNDGHGSVYDSGYGDGDGPGIYTTTGSAGQGDGLELRLSTGNGFSRFYHGGGYGDGCRDLGQDRESPHITRLIINQDPLTLVYQAHSMQCLGDVND